MRLRIFRPIEFEQPEHQIRQLEVDQKGERLIIGAAKQIYFFNYKIRQTVTVLKQFSQRAATPGSAELEVVHEREDEELSHRDSNFLNLAPESRFVVELSLSHKVECAYPGSLALSSELNLLVFLPLITNEKVRPVFWTTPTEKAERISQPTINIDALPGLDW